MSFSNNVKSELISAVTDKDKKYACLYGMILFCKKISETEICFQSENSKAADTFCSLIFEIFKNKVEIRKEKTDRKNGAQLFSICVNNTKLIFDTFGILPDERKIDIKNIDNNNQSCFVSGIFLSCGSMTDPNLEYHLEFCCPTERLAYDLIDILKSVNIICKITARKNAYIVYIKGSELIEDILTFMGAQNYTLEMMNIKILKDVRNRTNRALNCDMANCNKTVEAAARQKEDIEFIDQKMGLASLPATLQEMAFLRLSHPELSLKDLGELLDPPISRSGVNHRIKRLMQIADEIRTGGGT